MSDLLDQNSHELTMASLAFSEAVAGRAHFVKIGSFDRGEYACDLPKDNDPRVLPFREVPPLVYSEAITELQALFIRQKES